MRSKLAFAALVILLIASQLVPVPMGAAGGPRITGSTVQATFPTALSFKVNAESDADITDIRLQYQVDRTTFARVISESFVEFAAGRSVKGSWDWDMRRGGGLPPGAVIHYWWLARDAAGNRAQTDPAVVSFDDTRYKWRSLSRANVNLRWYDGDDAFGGKIMAAALQAIDRMGRDTGARLEKPASIYIYANSQDLKGSMINPQEWTGGVAFSEFGIIAIGIATNQLEWGSRAVAHELTHLVTYQMTANPYNSLPTWLNEGLSMYAEGELDAPSVGLLKLAVSQNRLISVRSLTSPFSAYGQEAALDYAESYSLVQFLVNGYGQSRMSDLLATFRKGSAYDDAFLKVYGFDMDGLNSVWQQSLKSPATPKTALVPGGGKVAVTGENADPTRKSFTIRDLPAAERPRERLQKSGAENLSAQELLAVLLGRGIAGESVLVTAQRLLGHFGSLKGIGNASCEELSAVRGIGLAKACQIKAAFELGARSSSTEAAERPVVKTPEDVAALVQARLKDKKKEYFLALLLDTRNRLLKLAEISVGSLDASIVHPREVFKEAVAASSASVIFVHNHPSGETEASQEDIALSKRLDEAGKIMGIDVLDHVIIGDGKYRSLKREGLF